MIGVFGGCVVEKFCVVEVGCYEIFGWVKKKGDVGGEVVVYILVGEVELLFVFFVFDFFIDLEFIFMDFEFGVEIVFVFDFFGDSFGDVVECCFFIWK